MKNKMKDTDIASVLGTATVIQLINIIFKISGFINWSWWVVFAPTFMVLIIAALIFVVERKW